MMNKGRAKNIAAQLRLEGKLARVVPFMSDRQAEYLVYYRGKVIGVYYVYSKTNASSKSFQWKEI